MKDEIINNTPERSDKIVETIEMIIQQRNIETQTYPSTIDVAINNIPDIMDK